MRFGRWVVEGDSLRLDVEGFAITAELEDLVTPARVCGFAWTYRELLTAVDVIDLHVAANELVWNAFDFTGVGSSAAGACEPALAV